jgi:diguanylate cyclase (GGDEF)-like protein
MSIEKNILNRLSYYYFLGQPELGNSGRYEDLRIIEANEALLTFMGNSRKEVVGKTFSEIYPFIFDGSESEWLLNIDDIMKSKCDQTFEVYSTLFEKWLKVNVIYINKKQIGVVISDINQLMKRLIDYKDLSNYSLDYLEFRYGEIDYQLLADNIWRLVGAEFVMINIVNHKENNFEMKAISGMPERVDRLKRILDKYLKLIDMSVDKRTIKSSIDKIFNMNCDEYFEEIGIDKEISEAIKTAIPIEQVWIVRINYKGHMIGTLTIIMPPNAKKPDTEILEAYSSQLAILLLRKAAEEEILYLSFHDKLTGLYNRRYFLDALDRLDTPRQYPISIVMGDANGLKLINDAFGHHAGDEFLIRVAEIMKECCRQEDILSRIGGDEFVILLPGVSYAETHKITNRIKEMCEREHELPIKLSIALGAATKESISQDINEVLKLAEDRMYSLKISESKRIKREIINDLLQKLKRENPSLEKKIAYLVEWGIKFMNELDLEEQDKIDYILLSEAHNLGDVAFLSDENREGIDSKSAPLHSEIGFRIAASSLEYAHIADFILKHHEKWDGTGYPLKLKGEEVPKIVRIFSIVNHFVDNLIDYGKDYEDNKDRIIEIIKSKAGFDFDPNLTEQFIKLLVSDDQN